MRIEKDYEELLKLLNENKVRYCIVGAFALAYYAKPRFTKDMDILVEPGTENAKKVFKALSKFGFKNIGLSEKDFIGENKVIQLGYEPLRIDIMTSIEGCSFNEIWKNKKSGKYGLQKVYYAGIKSLIKNKRVLNRAQDKYDLKALLRAKG